MVVVHAGTRVSQDIGACRRCGRAHGDRRDRAAAPAIGGDRLSGRTRTRRRLLLPSHAKGPSGLAETVRGLFETESPQTLLHLLYDDRERVGAGPKAIYAGRVLDRADRPR